MEIHIIKSSYTSWFAYIEKNQFKIEKIPNNLLGLQNTEKTVPENNSKKLIIIFQYKKIF